MEQFMDMELHISVTHFGTKVSSKMVKEQVLENIDTKEDSFTEGNGRMT